jgi:ComF family protein
MIKKLIQDLFFTIFPDLCLACDRLPKSNEASFCVECLYRMPYTDHFYIKNNKVTNHFKGRISIKHGAAILSFKEGGMVQNMLHKFKYKRRKEIGEIMGKIGAARFLHSKMFDKPDIIIPVPVHIKKIKRRGYNQSSIFGRSLGVALDVPFSDDVIVKTLETESQTGKSRTDRVKNVAEVFTIRNAEVLKGCHVLVVDDVITTGATLEACCTKVLEAGASSISILSIAIAE